MKRIIICADGTWNSPEQGRATNVLRLSRAIAPFDVKKREQVVFYDWGIGTDRKKLSGGATGAGIDKNIQDCYRFIVHNYDPGDELFFFGFSRGAYTVRSLGGFIRNCGVLKRQWSGLIPDAYDHYRKRSKKSRPDDPSSRAFRKKHALADRTMITFVGVWDTVGALGIPIPFLGVLDDHKFLFHDTQPSSIIQCARHAVSIDENREDFAPALWDHDPRHDVRQVWFPGVHTDLGGGYKHPGLSDGAFDWMIREAQDNGLVLEDHLLKTIKPNPRDRIHNEYKGIYRLRRRFVRNLIPKKRNPTEPAPLIHVSTQIRWKHAPSKYRTPAFKRYFATIGNDWSKVSIVT